MAINRCQTRLRDSLGPLCFAPVDLAALAAFRIIFGLLMAGAMVRFLAKGWVRELYVQPAFHFTYPGFEWVRPWPDFWLHAHFVALAVLALFIATGFCFRAAAALFFLGFTYVELLDQTTYLNHYYLISLLCGLLILLPANRLWSLDAWRSPSLRADLGPAWTLNLLRFQVGVVYIFAGIAKLNADWLFEAQPLRIWLAARSDLPLVGLLMAEPWVAYAASWFGAAYDLSIVFMLLCARTRPLAYAAVVVFHVATWTLFNIGMFPWIMMANSLVFLPPDWPRRAVATVACQFKHRLHWNGLAQTCQTAFALPWVPRAVVTRRPRLVAGLIGAFALVQVALPLRPYSNAESAGWSCRGFNLAWQVMVVEKTGYVEFFAENPATGERRRVRPSDYLTPRQEVMMAQDPQLIRILARRMAADFWAQGQTGVQIKVNAYATLNGRASQKIIDSSTDLAGPLSANWILPLEQ